MATPSRNDATLRVPLETGRDLPRARFLGQLADRGLIHLGHDDFAAEVDAAAAAALGEPVLVRASADGDELEAFVRLEDGGLALLDYGYGSLTVEVAAPARETVTAALARLRGALAAPEPEEDAVSRRGGRAAAYAVAAVRAPRRRRCGRPEPARLRLRPSYTF